MTAFRNTARALPTMLRVGLAEAFAYRAETLVWILATTMPLVMLALWHTVASEAPVGRFGGPEMVAYFVSMFIVRQLTGCWSAWLINTEVRSGALALRMLRPVHPLLSYATSSLTEMPVRSLLSVPAAFVVLLTTERGSIAHDPWIWALWGVSIAGGWTISLFMNLIMGLLALFLDSSTKLMDVYTALFFVFSGYLFPVEFFPRGLREVVEFLPFRYQLGLPVELMTGAHDVPTALWMLAKEALVGAVLFGIVVLLWRRGSRRFDAFGG
jgi:ABC-2 type transport system permease protein